MHRYVVHRILLLIPVVLGVSFIIFSIMNLTPGDPAQLILGENATREQIEELREEMGLNENFFVRYFKYLGNALTGDFGNSYRTGLPVYDEVFARFPNTVFLAFCAISLSAVLGIPIGVISAVRQYTFIDYLSLVSAMVLTSIPSFWLGLLFMLLFALRLDLLPSVYDRTFLSLIMPMMTLAVGSMAVIIRMTRSTMLEVIRQDYIRTAKAKGAAPRQVLFKHAFRNTLLPVVTIIGLNFGVHLGGAMVNETVFSIPGLGSLMVTSIRQRDTPMVLASVLLVCVAAGIVNLLVDILYAYIDPRVKSHYIRS